MAMYLNTKPVPTGASAIFRAVNRLEGIVETIINWNASRKTATVLNSLSDKQLEDIGLSRGDIDGVANRR